VFDWKLVAGLVTYKQAATLKFKVCETFNPIHINKDCNKNRLANFWGGHWKRREFLNLL